MIIEVYNSRGAHGVSSSRLTSAASTRPPVFAPVATTIDGQEGQELQVAVSATDAAGNALIYWADNLPPGAVFDPSQQTLTWTPQPGQAGTYTNVTFLVSDGITEASESTTLLIAQTDQPPTLIRPVDRTILEGEALQISLVASSADGNPLTYSSNLLPAGATLDPNTGVFDWTPGYDQQGVYQSRSRPATAPEHDRDHNGHGGIRG